MTPRIVEALLVLADGTTFEGEAIGAVASDLSQTANDSGWVATGEVVFNTVLTGYQEVITDPSYAGQIITFTYPHIGNYGATDSDNESARPFCRGVIVREMARRRSNWRSEGDLNQFLQLHGVPGIAGIDTRRLARHLRDAGSMPGAFGTADHATLARAAALEPGTDGVDLTAVVTCNERYSVGNGLRRVVAYDFGIKRAILSQLAEFASVEVVPAHTSAADVLALEPDGVFLSNGPGDPAAVGHAVTAIGQLLGEVPIFGICLGHQLLATALGATTYKLPFGHHGGNHPVRRLSTGSIEITSQNHNYCVNEGSLNTADLTHVNLNDGTVEGIASRDVPAFSVQYHPEAGPGPHDARYLFGLFDELMETNKPAYANRNGGNA
ncbi:MAG: glutamine-hydrolyzing carbamoyl-phosphate synthase small subunit [Actinomycetes bacterium]